MLWTIANSAAEPSSGVRPEPELFGCEAGAFTGAVRDRSGRVSAAESGTLFLDEIGDLPPSLQVKILHLLQERRYEPLGEVASRTADVRIVAATNRDLKSLVDCGAFRPVLNYRVNVIRMVMPPLRDRPCEVPLSTVRRCGFGAACRSADHGRTGTQLARAWVRRKPKRSMLR